MRSSATDEDGSITKLVDLTEGHDHEIDDNMSVGDATSHVASLIKSLPNHRGEPEGAPMHASEEKVYSEDNYSDQSAVFNRESTMDADVDNVPIGRSRTSKSKKCSNHGRSSSVIQSMSQSK